MLKNTAKFDYYELSAIFGLDSLKNISNNFVCTGVANDTREIEPGNIFVALKGENIDAHTKISEAFEKGATAAMVNIDWYNLNDDNKNLPLIVVNNTLHALGKLGNFHRKKFDYPVIAVAGSNGKTTTKNMISHLLKAKYRVLSTHENFNNQLGTALMLLLMSDEFNCAIIEIGTNEPGEIAILSSMVDPTHGIITNIGKEHLEKLIDLDGVEMEECFLYGYLKKMNRFAFVNVDDVKLRRYVSHLEKRLTYGTSEDAEVKSSILLDPDLHPYVSISNGDSKINFRLKTCGLTTGWNATAAVAVGIELGLDEKDIVQTMESYEQELGHGYARMVVEKINGINLINDCYNANPDSMKAALNTLKAESGKGTKFAVLGDMRELGDAAEREHRDILSLAAESADFVLVTGEEMTKAAKYMDDVHLSSYKVKEKLTESLIKAVRTGDTVLVKGSRGMRMEEIIEVMKKRK